MAAPRTLRYNRHRRYLPRAHQWILHSAGVECPYCLLLADQADWEALGPAGRIENRWETAQQRMSEVIAAADPSLPPF